MIRPSHSLVSLLLAGAWLSGPAAAHPPEAHRDAHHADALPATEIARGVVFHDQDGNGRRDAGEPGVPRVRVSNGSRIVRTDEQGQYEIAVGDDTIVFVIKPRDWKTPVSEAQLPQFYYIHKPHGSPESRFAGVPPTGPLPESIDFPLTPADEPDTFRALLFGDPQPRNIEEVEFIAHDVVEQIIREDGHGASFGVTLGDIAFDNLDTLEPLNQVIALIGIPWYNVIGNHDMNYDSPDDKHSDETFERIYGPSYYSFDHGPVHFLVLDDVTWVGATEGSSGRYHGGLGKEQMEFIRADLAEVPEEQLIVLLMHIPLIAVEDRQELYRLIEKRPFALSVSAHAHYMEHRLIDQSDGWQGPEPHHHVINVTVCGSWWQGAPDEHGIPHATMSDGGPNGYSILSFDGAKYDLTFRAARRPADHQMNIFLPEQIARGAAAETEMVVNVFAGSEKSTVEFRMGESGNWIPMERVVRTDPYFEQLKQREESLSSQLPPVERGPNLPWRPLPSSYKTPHIWRANLPESPAVGTQRVEVRTTDMFGKIYTDSRSIRVVE